MSEPVENLRLAFPAEITAAYFGISQLLNSTNSNSPNPETESVTLGICLVGILLIINLLIYRKFYVVPNKYYYLFVSIGFLVWVINIDGPRYNDFFFGQVDLIAGITLIFYPLVSMFIKAPKPLNNR